MQELHYWEFHFWVGALLSYLSFAEDPTKDAEFVDKQLRFITDKVREIAEGKGVIHRL